MPVIHVNRAEDTYYLHSGTTKTGKTRYWFSMSQEGELVDSVPEGYEIYENPTNQVFLRKIKPQVILPLEVATVEAGLKRYAPEQNCLVDVQGEHIVIYHADRIDYGNFGIFGFKPLPVRYSRYEKVMRFTLINQKTRAFRVERWCFRGSIDDWIGLYLMSKDCESLSDLVQKFAPHLGQESFFELH
jgi:hypothetical protein